MTTLLARPTTPTRGVTLRTLARVEASRYARHPLFLLGTGLLVALLVIGGLGDGGGGFGAESVGDVTVVPAFFLGIFGIFIGFRLTLSMGGSREPVEAAPTDGVVRTAALCLACLVPGLVALVCYVWMDGWLIPRWPGLSAGDRSAILFEGVIYAVGGPLLGVLVGRWARFPGAALVTALALYLWVGLAGLSDFVPESRMGTLIHLNAPYATWLLGPDESPNWVNSGSPQWYLVYLALLCGLAAITAVLHEARGAQRSRLLRVLVVLALLAVISLALTVAPDPTRHPL